MEFKPPGKAIQFIYIDDKTEQFGVTPEAMALLASIPREKQVKVLAIAGPYRTGKSFLLNRVLDQMIGFEIGATPKTPKPQTYEM